MNDSLENPDTGAPSSRNVANGHAFDDACEDAIGEKLREAFSDVLNEPVPQRFVDLLKNLSSGSGS